MQRLVVLTGAGISAESGLKTFRDSGGLWEGYNVMEVATPEGWQRNPKLVLQFYNDRRKQALSAKPNRAHLILAELQNDFDVTIITQNVDNLHEQGGSKNVIHLHGNLFESRSSEDESLIYPIDGWELKMGDVCEKGSQLRPNIVWFGELVPMIVTAAQVASDSEIFLIVGTSLQVYPAASLIDYVKHEVQKIVIDPKIPDNHHIPNVLFLEEKAVDGMKKVKEMLLQK